jgi:hypothetical protein
MLALLNEACFNSSKRFPSSASEQTVSILFNILQDPGLAPAFRRIFADPKPDLLTTALTKAEPRRFVDAEPSAFGDLIGIGRVGSLRWREVREQEAADQVWDAAAERDEAGE